MSCTPTSPTVLPEGAGAPLDLPLAELVSRIGGEGVTAFACLAAELRLSPDQACAAAAAFFAEFERRLPSFVTVVALAALLPLLGERARRHALSAGESPQDAEDVGQDVAMRILDASFGRWPRGNVGAWVGTLCAHALSDQHRGHARAERAMARGRERCRTTGG